MRRGERGFALLAMLAAVALLGLAMAIAGPSWAQREQREREQELLRVGLLYAQALAAYRDSSPGGAKVLPQSLLELTLDKRFIGMQRHLRRLYADPIEPSSPWGLVQDEQGRILGIYSQSRRKPLAQQSLALPDRGMPPAESYSDWKFMALEAQR